MVEEEYFTRELEISTGTIKINQATVGDVGCVVWDAAIVLAKFLDGCYFKENYGVRKKRFIELGAGTGLVGLTAACLGALVVLTDLKELVPLLEKNINSNQHMIIGECVTKPLKWGDELSNNIVKPDVILVADCIYYEESLLLVKTLKGLCASHTTVFMSYEKRDSDHKRTLLNRFLELAGKDFDSEMIAMDFHDSVYRSRDIHILKMNLKL